MAKKEKDMDIIERIKLHNDDPSEIMEAFLKEIVTLDYSNQGTGKAAAFLYNIIT